MDRLVGGHGEAGLGWQLLGGLVGVSGAIRDMVREVREGGEGHSEVDG